MTRGLQRTSRLGTFSEADLAAYRQAWSQTGPTGDTAYRTMIHWYRAFAQRRPPLPAQSQIYVPTLLIWGAQDAFLIRDMAQPSIDLCTNGRLIVVETATHWVQHEEADLVNQLLIEFLKQ